MEEKKYFLKVNGERIEVSEEVYREYMRLEWCEVRKKNRDARCRDENGNRCNGDCDACPYALDGGKLRGGTVSLDALMDEEDGEGFDIADPNVDVEREAERDELRAAFVEARYRLSEKERIFFDMLMEGFTVKEISERLSVTPGAVVHARKRLYRKLRVMMADFR